MGHVDKVILRQLTVIFFVVAIFFGNSLFNGFAYDDNIVLVGNKSFSGFDLKEIFLGMPMGVEYFPVRDFTFALDYQLWGENAFGFHLSNLMIYILFLVALYFFILKLNELLLDSVEGKTSKNIAFLTTVLFAVHPMHSETVNFISGRGSLLSGFFFLLSLIFYLELAGKRGVSDKKNYTLTFMFFFLALFSKSYSIILPLILLAVELFNSSKLRSYMRVLPFFAISCLYFIVVKIIAFKAGVIAYKQIITFNVVAAKILQALQIPLFYTVKYILPINLAAEYDMQFSKDFFSVSVLTSLLFSLLVFLLCICCRKHKGYFLFSLLWFLFTLLPFLQILPTGTLVADRYSFIPSIALFYPLAVYFSFGANLKYRRNIMLFLIVLPVLWGAASIKQNLTWYSGETVWRNIVDVSPEYSKAYMALGHEYKKQGNTSNAIEYFIKAGKLNPSDNSYDLYMGLKAFEENNYKEALKYFFAARDKKTDLLVLFRLASTFERIDDLIKAAEYYNKTINHRMMDVSGLKKQARIGLKRVLTMMEPPLANLRKEAENSPGDLKILTELAMLLDNLGYYDEALSNYDRIKSIVGESWQYFYNVANIYKKTSKYEKSIEFYKKSLELLPANSKALNNIGLIYKELNDVAKAIEFFEKAMALDPYYKYPPIQLGILYFQMGEKEKAEYYFNYVLARFPDEAGVANLYLGIL